MKTKKEICIAWVGFHIEGLLAFKKTIRKGYNISVFITLSDKELAKRSAPESEYISICQEYQIPVLKVDHINTEEVIHSIKKLSVDLLIILGWSQIVSAEVLAIPKIGTVGAHASLLPHNRGSAPINWALIRGETEGGNTLMWLNEGVDTGRIIDQRSFPISEYDTCNSLYKKVAKTNNEMILGLLISLKKNNKRPCKRQSQNNEEILPRRRPKDGLVNWRESSNKVYNFIRALTKPYPGAFSYIHGKKIFIWKCTKLPQILNLGDLQPGMIIGPAKSPVLESCGLAVACGKGIVIINEIQFERDNPISGFQLSELNFGGKFFEEIT